MFPLGNRKSGVGIAVSEGGIHDSWVGIAVSGVGIGQSEGGNANSWPGNGNPVGGDGVSVTEMEIPGLEIRGFGRQTGRLLAPKPLLWRTMDNPRAKLMNPIRWCNNFCAQWRHGHLLLLGVFSFLWIISVVFVIPMLEGFRVWGLHPTSVFTRIHVLRLLWIPVWALVTLYALSFALESLNTAKAVAIAALASCVTLALFVLILITIAETTT